MPPFDRAYTTSCQTAIVSIALCCTVFELLDVENILTLKSMLTVTQSHWKLHHLIDHMSSCCHSMVEDTRRRVMACP